MNIVNIEFYVVEVSLTDQISKPLEIEDLNVYLNLIIG